MSQKELAEKVGVRRETIVRLESGQYNPSLRLAMDISKEFQVPVEEMFSFEEDPELLIPDKVICDNTAGTRELRLL